MISISISLVIIVDHCRSYINITDKALYKTLNKKDVIHGQILYIHILRPVLWLYKL